MVSPLERTQGLLATDILRSMNEQWEARRKEEDEKAGITQKVDPLVEARITVSDEARQSRAKIVSALFDHENVSVNELKMKIADQLAEKLGLEVDRSRSYLNLGKTIEELLLKMDNSARRELERAVGLDELGISLTTFVSALSDPTGEGNDRLVAALEKTAGRGGVTEAANRIFTRLRDIADPKTADEIKVQEEISDPARLEDAAGREERLQSLRLALASEKLEQISDTVEALTRGQKTAAENGSTQSADDQLTMLVAVTGQQSDMPLGDEHILSASGPSDQSGQQSSAENDEVLAATGDLQENMDEVAFVRVEDGLYQVLWALAA